MSGFVARNLSGLQKPPRGGGYETDRDATGGPEAAI